jgi:hypothetical protein
MHPTEPNSTGAGAVAKARESVTVGVIARRLNESMHRIEYAIRTRAIMPDAVAGIARVFDEDAVEKIAAALRDMDARREGVNRAK